MRNGLIAAALILAVSAAACGDKGKEESSSKASSEPAKASSSKPSSSATAAATAPPTASSSSEGGDAFTSKEGGYSARFPFGAPKESTATDKKNVEWKKAESTVGMYTVHYTDAATPAAAQAIVDDFIKTMKSEINENKEVTSGSLKGRELKMIVSPTSTMWLRFFVSGKRVFKVAAANKNNQEKAYEFLDSFKVSG